MKKILIVTLCISLFFTLDAQSQLNFKNLKNKVLKKKSGKKTTSGNTKSTNTGNAPLLSTLNFSNKGRAWYVSRNTGSGQLGTKERPAKDLGNIIHHLKPNDVIYIAEGTYLSKGKRGSDEINVPVKIYGGYDTSFTTRDPWDTHKTIFTGVNEYMKLTTQDYI